MGNSTEKIKRYTKTDENGIEEHYWEYPSSSIVTFYDKILMYLSIIYASHLLFHGIIYSFPFILLWLFNILSSKSIFIISILYFSTYLYPIHVSGTSWYWKSYKHNDMWELMKFYLDWITIRRGSTENISNKQYIFAIQPHGILACNRIQMMGNIFFNEIYPKHFGRFAAATPQFYTPGIRETCIFAGACDASKRTCINVLNNNESLYIWVGGSRELLLTNPDDNDTKIVIKDRKGFVKLAIQNGIDIIPCLQFGEKYIYYRKILPKFISKLLYKYFKIPGIFFIGRYFTFTPLKCRPNSNKVIKFGFVFDEPIKVNKQDNVTQEYMDEIHKEYMDRMKFMFDKYKNVFEYNDDETLTFVSTKIKYI